MELNLRNSKIAVMGIQGSGKTVWVKAMSKNFKTIVYTPHIKEWGKTKVHLAQYKSFLGDLEKFCEKTKKSKYDWIVIDEYDLVCSKGYNLKFHMNDLIINHRHYGKSLVVVTRRPQDIPTKLLESCHYLVCYSIEGENVIKKLNAIRKGFGDMVKNIPFESWKYAVKRIGEEPTLCEPVELV